MGLRQIPSSLFLWSIENRRTAMDRVDESGVDVANFLYFCIKYLTLTIVKQ